MSTDRLPDVSGGIRDVNGQVVQPVSRGEIPRRFYFRLQQWSLGRLRRGTAIDRSNQTDAPFNEGIQSFSPQEVILQEGQVD